MFPSSLDEQYKLKNVYVEGAYGNVDTSWLGAIKDSKIKNEIVETLLNQGKLTGSEYYSITSSNTEEQLLVNLNMFQY